MAKWDEYLYDWVDVGDRYVCPTCIARSKWPPMLFQDFPALPGDGHSECGGRCRCIFLPHELIALTPSFEGGKTILLEIEGQMKRFPISLEYEERVFREVDKLVGEYEKLTGKYYKVGDWNLPEEFYRLHGGDEKLAFLKKLIEWVKKGDFPIGIVEDILKTNDWWMRGVLPARIAGK
jgi:hypothetical protein